MKKLNGRIFIMKNLQAGLGERFLTELQSRYSEICEHPQFYGFIDAGKTIRDLKVKHFPYQVVYEIIENAIIVFSVFNSYQEPSKRNIK